MSGPSFSLFSDSQSLFSRNPSSSHVENTTENVELEGGKGNNINASSVDETPYQSLPDTNSEPVIGGVPVTDKGKGKVVEDSELGGSRHESVPTTETQPVDVDCSDDSQLNKKKIGQLRLFKKTCFGYFLNLPPVIVQIRVMHHLLIREVHHEVKNEMRFVVNDSRLRFGLGEFALVSGLKCKGDTSIESIAENRLISKYFGTASVTLAQLADCFKKKKWETYDDALKIAVLYFVNSFLLSQLKTKVISRSYIDLVECGDFNNYPWGIDVYNATIDSCSNKFQDKPSFYRLSGFPLALQIWLYECFPSLDGHFADHIGNELPRILNWLKNITPTDDEKQLFDVRGLSFEIEVECTDSQPDSFQVFGTQLPKTQSMHESTGGDSQPTNAEVMKELQGLKLFVETKFEEVLAAIGRQSMKPEGNSAHKQQDNDPDFREMHNDYDQFERGHVGNDPVVIGDSTPKAPSMSGFGGVGRDGGATGVNVKNVTSSHGVVNDDLRSVPFVNEHDFSLDSNFELSASAIDQITAITQQATYKQSSHDVKKSGPAPLPSGIPAQTRANVVIESNTAPQASRVDGVGQVDVGGSNVNLPSASCRHGGDLHLDSDFEYTDSQLDLIAAITQGGRRNVNQSGNELTTRDVNKSKPDQSVSRSIVQIQTDVETTPAVFTRRRRPAAVKQSPYRNDWQSGVSAVGGSSKVIKRRFPFVNDISVVVDYKLTTAFSNFVEANMQLGECVFIFMYFYFHEVYLPGDQKLDPCFDFEVEQIDDKMFFHTLNYSGRPLSSSHLNIIFYYLRKKAKYGINMPIKVTTTDTLFNNIIQRVFTEFVKGGKQDHLIDRSDDIMEYMKGLRMYCNTPWHQVDHVLFSINLAENWHWILGCVSFHKRCFYVYDSLRSRKHKKSIQKVAEAYVVLIPLFLVSIEFYRKNYKKIHMTSHHNKKWPISDIVVQNGLHMGKELTDPFEIEMITNLLTQQNS
ncbi:hypothetical protein A4A49_59973 [Nicotiana attenuata]|uniref:Ubiquitin-like protease family profile domain-containing protein n=1 Tax=Nicotiana attenuata TaxID=49451 RepID=A0A1J6I6U1_NICAT|nr:hypothetical protein A4A49_59973 [Nicotiana attenuata]